MTDEDDSDAAQGKNDLVLHFGAEQVVIRRRYETLSITNDVLIGLWFLIGSVLFFSDKTQTAATILFVIGSVEMLMRPVIRFAQHIHLQRIAPGRDPEESYDY